MMKLAPLKTCFSHSAGRVWPGSVVRGFRYFVALRNVLEFGDDPSAQLGLRK